MFENKGLRHLVKSKNGGLKRIFDMNEFIGRYGALRINTDYQHLYPEIQRIHNIVPDSLLENIRELERMRAYVNQRRNDYRWNLPHISEIQLESTREDTLRRCAMIMNIPIESNNI